MLLLKTNALYDLETVNERAGSYKHEMKIHPLQIRIMNYDTYCC